MLGQPEDNHPEDTDDTYPDYGLQVYDPPQEFKPVPYGTYDTGDRVTVPEDFTGYDDARPGIITYMLGNIKADIVITKEGDPPTHHESGHTYTTVRVPLECLELGY